MNALLAPPNVVKTNAITHSKFFAHERSCQVSTMEEALDACRDHFTYSRTTISFERIYLDKTLILTTSLHSYRLTEKAFDELCKVLSIPVNFAKDIPFDLTSTIVERLKALHAQSVVLVHRDKVVVGIVDPRRWTHSRASTHRPHFQPVSNIDLLRAIPQEWLPADCQPGIRLADSGIAVEALFPGPHFTLQPTVGDITRIGAVVSGSETGGPAPLARGYTLRLVCTNGAVVPRSFGEVRFNTDWRVDVARRLEAFGTALQSIALDLDTLRRAYDRLVADRLSDYLFYRLWDGARYAYRYAPDRTALADRCLGVEPERRREIVCQVRRRHADQRRFGGGTQAVQLTSLSPWDVFNAITAAARQEVFHRRLALQRLAGDVLAAYTPPPR